MWPRSSLWPPGWRSIDVTGPQILVLGAYGLAGRAIVERLTARTPHSVVAAGRSADKLQRLLKAIGFDQARGYSIAARFTCGRKPAAYGTI